MSNDIQLAIIIPAYKTQFLDQALHSIEAQTDKRFSVYIGDDASPENIKDICKSFARNLRIAYTRFDENLGHESLVAHWNRCVKLSSEPWIWLFCDDDIMDPECVENFYETLNLAGDHYDIYRFNTLTIDENNHVTRINPPHPQIEPGIHFAYHRIRDERASFVSEYIFSRKVFNQHDGFIDLPMAWCSDDATWITFAGSKGIYLIQKGRVRWRLSTLNVSSPNTDHGIKKIAAAVEYLRWLSSYYEKNKNHEQIINLQTLKKYFTPWFNHRLAAEAPYKFKNYFALTRSISQASNKGFLLSLLKLIYFDLKHRLKRKIKPFVVKRNWI